MVPEWPSCHADKGTTADNVLVQEHNEADSVAATAASKPLRELLSRCRQSPVEQQAVGAISSCLDPGRLNLYFQARRDNCFLPHLHESSLPL